MIELPTTQSASLATQTPRALLRYTAGSLTIAPDLTLDEARYVIEQLAMMVASRGTMRELTIESEAE